MPVQTQMQVRRGTASSWTSTNPTLAAGELGFETDTGKFKIGTGASTWTALPYAGGGQNTLTTYQYTATAGQTTFSGSDINSNTLAYTAGAVQVYLNGALLQNTVDYAASTGTSVVLTAGAGLGDSLTILSLGSFTVSTDIPKSTLTAKGSIVAASGAATPANLSVGANDTVLTADSSTATGLKWAAPGGGANFTLLNTGGTALTGSSITISGISAADKIFIIVENAGSTSTYADLQLRINADTGNNYSAQGIKFTPESTYSSQNTVGPQSWIAQNNLRLCSGSSVASNDLTGTIFISGANSSGIKVIESAFGVGQGGGSQGRSMVLGGIYTGTSVVSSVTILVSGTFAFGTVYVYTSA